MRFALEADEVVADVETPKTDETQTPAPATDATPETPPEASTPATEPSTAPKSTSTPADTTTPTVEEDAEEDEEPTQKKLKTENELVFYGKMVSFDELKTKASEYQEQYEVKIPKTEKNAIGGRIRIRKTVKGKKDPRYVMTTKTKMPDGSEYESDCKTSEENFIQFKYFCEGGMIKERYTFPVEGHTGLKWEVDVFTGTNGLIHEWVKIDLERDDQTIELTNLPPFPIQLTDVITNQNGQRTPEEEAIVRTLYDTVFRTPNPIISAK